ncbi:MAG: HPF/RaiA family ribosome-associated protein [Anaeromyxobacteraceae bacterium]
MKLQIHSQHIEAPRDVVSFVKKHVIAPLRRLHDSPASELVVYIEDTKPAKGGVDQACKMTFRMPGSRAMRVESVNVDLHASLLDCAQRLKRLVQRQVMKQRSTSRSPQHRPLGRTWRARSSNAGTTPAGEPATL